MRFTTLVPSAVTHTHTQHPPKHTKWKEKSHEKKRNNLSEPNTQKKARRTADVCQLKEGEREIRLGYSRDRNAARYKPGMRVRTDTHKKREGKRNKKIRETD